MNVDRNTPRVLATAALLTLVSAACASHPAPPSAPPGAAASTGAEVGSYTPNSIVLYVARREIAGACRDDLSPSIEFAPAAAEVPNEQKVEIEKWALCLQRPELANAKLAILRPVIPAGEPLFAERARHLRDLLAARGVAPARIIIGPTPANVESEAPPSVDALRLGLVVAGPR